MLINPVGIEETIVKLEIFIIKADLTELTNFDYKNNLDAQFDQKKLNLNNAVDNSFLFKVFPLMENDIIQREKLTDKINNRDTSTNLEMFILPLTIASSIAITQPATYYISQSGNDQNSGTSPTSAWRSLSKVNSMTFAPGDKILLEGGSTFTGQLYFDSKDQGSVTNPITIGSYGGKPATINAGSKTGVYIYNSAGYQVSDLNIVGSGVATNTGDGINFYNDLAGNVKLDTIAINNVNVSGFRGWGIAIGSWNQQSGFRNVDVMSVKTFNNGIGGLLTYAQVPNVHENVKVSYTRAYSNLGISNVNYATGNGITLGGVKGGVIERSIAYDNGRFNTNLIGPSAIWTYDSTGVVIQYNEAYRNRTGSSGDGNGFGLDQNVSHSILQYNYSHENDGAGLLVCQQGNAPTQTNNVVRYNISQNDGRKSGWGGIHLFGPINNTDIYNNTVYVQSSSTTFPDAVLIYDPVNNVRFYNNIFQTRNNARLIDITNTAATQSTGLVFQGNNYFSSGTPFRIQWGSTIYNSLESWRMATQQEQLNGQTFGSSVDPLLNNPGGGTHLNNTDLLNTLSSYRLQPNSPMIDRGLNLIQLLGGNLGNQDFYGNSLPQGLGYDIGANEF